MGYLTNLLRNTPEVIPLFVMIGGAVTGACGMLVFSAMHPHNAYTRTNKYPWQRVLPTERRHLVDSQFYKKDEFTRKVTGH